MVTKQVNQLISLGALLPVIFLSVSIFMLYVVLKKMIEKDQCIIGTMKALGMADLELIGAYLVQGILIGGAGALLGCLAAIPFGNSMFAIYVNFFSLPDSVYHNFLDSRIHGFVFSVATSITAVFLGVRGILRITPAQAMRAGTPGGAWNLKFLFGFFRTLDPLAQMGVRSITRNPLRGFLIVLAIGFPFSMAAVLFSFRQFTEQMYFQQFDQVQTYDIQVLLPNKVPQRRASETGPKLRGVIESEGVAQFTVQLQNDSRTEFAKLYGLNRHSSMWKIMDLYGVFYQPPDDGVIINSHTAEKLHIKVGDILDVTCNGLTTEPVKIPVTAIITENFGSSCYMSGEGIQKFLYAGSMSNTITVKVQNGYLDQVKNEIYHSKQVASLVDTGRILKSYREQMESTMSLVNVFSLISVAAGGILIFNISMINIRERLSEFGTLRLMGNSDMEIARILTFEQLIYFIFGILLGIPGSLAVRGILEKILETDTSTIILFTQASAYFKAFFICLVITVLAFLAQVRVIKKIQITEVLKERE